jgi:hypothetical protein
MIVQVKKSEVIAQKRFKNRAKIAGQVIHRLLYARAELRELKNRERFLLNVQTELASYGISVATETLLREWRFQVNECFLHFISPEEQMKKKSMQTQYKEVFCNGEER